MTADLDAVRRLEDGGCAALVMHSLFEEQITLADRGEIHHRDPLDPEFAAALASFPAPADYHFQPSGHLEHLHLVKQAVKVPVIGSLNGTTSEGWLRYARLLQEAGADAIEVNVYSVMADLDTPGLAVETGVRDLVTELKRSLRIPLAVKLSPFFSAFGNFAMQLDAAGADALVIFNRFYQPDIDVREMTAAPHLELSHSPELRLRLRWLALLHGRLRGSLALTGGVETPTDGIKGILAGAHAIQMVSAILRHGPSYFSAMRDGLAHWMEQQEITVVDDMRGRVSLQQVPDAGAFERANYLRTLHSWGK